MFVIEIIEEKIVGSVKKQTQIPYNWRGRIWF